MKSRIIWTIVVLAILGAVFGVVKFAQTPSISTGGELSVPVSPGDQTRGPKEAKTVLVEYSDFQCPACANFYPHIEEMDKELGDKFLFVYRHFPLPQHENAKPAAYAAEAAGKQGKFWEMYKIIFDRQNDWAEKSEGEKIFADYAKELGLNMAAYETTVGSKEVKDKVDADNRTGLSSRVNSTPTFFLNGKKMEGFKSYDDFKNLIRQSVQAGA